MNTNKKEHKGYVIHMPPDLMAELRQIASNRGDPVSVLIREALREYLRALADKTYEIPFKTKGG